MYIVTGRYCILGTPLIGNLSIQFTYEKKCNFYIVRDSPAIYYVMELFKKKKKTTSMT